MIQLKAEAFFWHKNNRSISDSIKINLLIQIILQYINKKTLFYLLQCLIKCLFFLQKDNVKKSFRNTTE